MIESLDTIVNKLARTKKFTHLHTISRNFINENIEHVLWCMSWVRFERAVKLDEENRARITEQEGNQI